MASVEFKLDKRLISEAVSAALAEDIGHGDVTTDALVGPDDWLAGDVVVEASGVLAGAPIAVEVFSQLDERCRVTMARADGSAVGKGEVALSISGAARALLSGERTALNYLQRLSGIATLTRRYVEEIDGTSTSIADTRKTTPGMRAFEKYAVRLGGSRNHRFGLYDGVMVKDNHILACGSITHAVERLRNDAPHTLKIEVECDSIDQVREALAAGADVILLDNMAPSRLREAVGVIGGQAVVEASGGVTLENVRAIAETGVNLISVGAITHSAPILPMRFDCRWNGDGGRFHLA